MNIVTPTKPDVVYEDGIKPIPGAITGEYTYTFPDGTQWVIHNLITLEGMNNIASVFAGLVEGTRSWIIGLLGGPVSKNDTMTLHGWTEPDASTGYARQTTTVSGVVNTTKSGLDVACIEYNPVTFQCGKDNQAWDVPCTNAWLGMNGTSLTGTQLISIGAKQPNTIRLIPGASFQLGYRQYFG